MTKLQKDTRLKSENYLAWVRTQPCMGCGAEKSIDAHHLRGVGSLCGGGQKNHDLFVCPLCHDCHAALHNQGWNSERQYEMIVRTLDRAMKAGILTEKGIQDAE
jgi:hypothetical protein